MNKIVFLASWYPGRVDFLSGDFVERHVKAISLKNEVTVIFVCKDPSLKEKIFDIEFNENGNLKVYKYYYKESENQFSLVRKIISQFRYFKGIHKIYSKEILKNGKPDLVHLYIPLKAGIYALYLNLIRNTKYVVSEQSSFYMPASGLYEKKSFFSKWIIKLIFKRASAIHTVSQALGNVLTERKLISDNFHVIANVVDTKIFYPSKIANYSNHFVTITGNVFHKNTDGIFRSLKKVSEKRNDFKLFVVGPYKENLKALANKTGLGNHIIFCGALPYGEVAEINRHCSAMIFFTRYETFGCVIIEANACGLPVIASDLPVIRENIEENINGIFVKPEDEDDLSKKLLWFMDHKNQFNKDEIAFVAKNKFNYKVISDQFDEFYKNSINKQ